MRKVAAAGVVVLLLGLVGPAVGTAIARGALSGLFPPVLGLAVTFSVVGAFLLLRGANTAIAGLMSGIGVLAATSCATGVWREVHSSSWPDVTGWLRTVENFASLLTLTLLVSLTLLLPNGRVPRRWVWAVVADALLLVGFVVTALADPTADFITSDPSILFDGRTHPGLKVVTAILFLALVALFLISVGALAGRRRGAVGVERGQLTCLLFGGGVAAVLLAVTIPAPVDTWWGFTALAATPAVLPLSIAVAVLRYRLYEIDRVVSRTVTYALVLVVLAAVYVGVVAGLTALVPRDLGQVGVAAATLAVSILAVPLTRRVRRVVDRRFNRRRYDADLLVTRYAERLRHGVDHDAAGRDLLAVVQRSLEPTHSSVWLVSR